MLVHMSPQEVQSLQELAMKNGGSLTINPETGLPEAGFLDSILPMIVGIALGPAGFGLMSAGMAGLAVGGVTALATGSLEKGLMAGMGAYGGAGLSGALAGAGEGAMGLAASEAAQQEALKQGLQGEASNQFVQNAVTDKLAAATPFDKLSAGFTNLGTEAGRTAAMDAMGGGMGALKYGAAAVSPMLADQMVQTTTKAPTPTNTGTIRQKMYDPISGTYTEVGPVDASKWGNRSFSDIYRGYADGGIVALAPGGMTNLLSDITPEIIKQLPPDVLNGGTPAAPATATVTAPAPAPTYAPPTDVGSLYSTVLGRQAKPEELAYWNNAFRSQNITDPTQELAQFKAAAAPEWAAHNPQQAAVATPAANTGITALTNNTAATAATTPASTANTGITALTNNAATTANTPGANNAATGTGGDSGVLTALANAGAQNVLGATTANTGAAVSQIGNIKDMYQSVLGRTPSADEINYWNNAFTTNKVTDPKQQLAQIQAAAAPEKAIPENITKMYQDVLGRTATADELSYWNNAFRTQGITDFNKEIAQFKNAATPEITNQINNIYRNVLGRDADAGGLKYWKDAITTGNQSLNDVYAGLLGAAGTNKEQVNKGVGLNQATNKYTGYEGADTSTTADEWVRNILNREPTEAEKNSTWYKQAVAGGKTPEEGLAAYNNFLRAHGMKETTDMADVAKASQLKALNIIGLPTGSTVSDDGKSVVTQTGVVLPIVTTDTGQRIVVNPTTQTTSSVTAPTGLTAADKTALPVGISGNQSATINPNGTIAVNTGTPNMPPGGYTGMDSLRYAYTQGGGNLGYNPYTPKTIDELNRKYQNTNDSLAAYAYLTGKGANPTQTVAGRVARPYGEAVMGLPAAGNRPYIWDQASGKYLKNPDYVRPMRDSEGNVSYTMSQNEMKTYLNDPKNKNLSGQALYDWATSNNLSAQDIADAKGVSLSSIYAQFRDAKKVKDTATKAAEDAAAKAKATAETAGHVMAGGGMAGYAVGGGLGSLGSYSDGGRLLRGPGDGVSDSIPASIGQNQQPARLADGEFVVPARIVSELGNGSTEAGARKLYAMMDRVQRARGKTTGKDRVAANTSADKYLPA
jgi:hypothetical protein